MILIVDDEKYVRSSLAGLLGDEGYETQAVASAEKAEEILDATQVDMILLDIQMPGKDGITFLDDNKNRLKDIPVVVISGRGDIPTAVAAIKLGAYDYIEKPLSPERVLVTVRQASRLSKSLRSEKRLVGRLLEDYTMIGQSEAMVALRRTIDRAAAGDSTVLITGDNGTGKELVAHHIHYLSERKSEPLVTVHCPAIPEHLFESELFGHVRGAFTGAGKDRAGRVETAGHGSLFLDEIGELPLVLQGKLLRLLESGQFEKVGSDTTLTARCRLIAATNRDLKGMVAQESFREDLYYRLNVVAIHVPPLRDRIDDIPLLAGHFLSRFSAEGEYILTPDAVGALASYEWPGNIRQVKNLIQQIIFNCEPGEISAPDIDRIYHDQTSEIAAAETGEGNRLTAAIRRFETGYLSQLYRTHGGNIAAMARDLKMDRGNLSRKLKALGIV